jgi:hypothetical protein
LHPDTCYIPDIVIFRIQELVVCLDHVVSLIFRNRREILLADGEKAS